MKYLKWLWKLITFVVWLPWIGLMIILDGLNTFMMHVTGGAPTMQTLVLLRHHWRDLWGIKIEKSELDVVNGYMYYKYTYTNGAQELWRGA